MMGESVRRGSPPTLPDFITALNMQSTNADCGAGDVEVLEECRGTGVGPREDIRSLGPGHRDCLLEKYREGNCIS